MSITSQLRDEVYWQQRCIAAEAREQSQKFELTQLQQTLKHYKEQTTFWRQRFILAEAKAHTNQNVGRRTETPSDTAGQRGPKVKRRTDSN